MLFRIKDEKAKKLEAQLNKLQKDGPAAWALSLIHIYAVAAALAAKKVQRFLLDHAEVTSVTDSAEKE